MLHTAEKSRAEKEDEAIADGVKESPKHKPPRYDRRTRNLKDVDPDLNRKDKDLSLNYKDAALTEAICLVAMRMRGVNPSYGDLTTIKHRLASVDLSNPSCYPKVAAEVLAHLDATRTAAYRTIVRSEDGRTFEMGEPQDPRRMGPEGYNNELTPTPSEITEQDLNRIVAEAKRHIDRGIMNGSREAAFRHALDMAIHTMDGGKYDHKINAPTYLVLLNKITNSKLDLAEDTYVPQLVDSQQKQQKRQPFDLTDFFGEVAVAEPDNTRTEAWRKHFDHPGPYEYDKDEPYMRDFKNPNV